MIEIDIHKKLYGVDGEMDLDIELSIKEGEFVAISGVSGSGKTTLLRSLAGLEEVRGNISVGGKIYLDDKNILAPSKREIGFVFQDYALFPNLSVLDNLLYVKKDKALAEKLLQITQLSALSHRAPNSLSGGQKQRVSLCRAMMNKPKLLLLDEPLSALDPVMRLSLQQEILALHKEFNTTTIMVSHDPSEIYRLSSRVLVLEKGKIINDGSAREVLLKTSGSAKFSFEGEILEIREVDVIYIAIIAIGQQIVELVLSAHERLHLNVGDTINVSTKAFTPHISR